MNRMKNTLKSKNLSKMLVLPLGIASVLLVSANPAPWSYDQGPQINSTNKVEAKNARDLIDLNAHVANAPEISAQVTDRQRFRWAYGPIPWRMTLKPDSVKILFMGQDGTHIAEAANRPATAGFGGRAQDLARYFGVNESAAFINNYAFTINGQYNTANHPYIDRSNGADKVFTSTFLDNKMWLLSQDQGSPVTQWRSSLVDWIIRNNINSLQLIVAFGGAAKDGVSAFIKSRGGEVDSRFKNKMADIQMPETSIVGAGSNKQFAVVVDENGHDLYQQLEGRLDYTDEAAQNKATASLKNRLAEYLQPGKLVFSKGGPAKNGMLDAAQLGGYNIEKLSVGGKETISLKGLKLKGANEADPADDVEITRDILVVQLPHPTALSMMTPDDASETVAARLKILEPYKKTPARAAGWEIEPDWKVEPDATGQGGEKFVNNYAGEHPKPYVYGRSDIDSIYYDFGTPASRMVSVSSASRMSGRDNAHIIVFGSRDKGVFDTNALAAMTGAEHAPADKGDERFDDKQNLLTTRPRVKSLLNVWDPGPNVLNDDGTVKIGYAEIMKKNLNFKEIYRMKNNTEWDKEKREHQEMPISNFNIKTHPMIADFGHYRGTFKDPRVVIIADPIGYDDMVTSRALTGERGQYLHGLMRDMKVGDKYLVIKTVPFGMDGATADEWAKVISLTADYRKKIFETLLANSNPGLILTDGPQAKKIAEVELKELLHSKGLTPVNIDRSKGEEGLVEAGKLIANVADRTHPLLAEAKDQTATGERANIPRSHLTFYARAWEGTSKDCVLASTGELAGIAFAEVAPRWAWKENLQLTDEQPQVDALNKKLDDANLPKRNESIPAFIERIKGRIADFVPGLK
jgi:hypothetical protein